MKKILIIRYRFIGDTILTTPFIKNLKKIYPQSSIDILVGPNSGDVLKNCPYIDSYIVYDTTKFHKYDSSSSKNKSKLQYYINLFKNKYDIVFCLKRSFGSKLLSLVTCAKEKYGYKSSSLDNLIFNKSYQFNPQEHEIISTLNILKLAKDYNPSLELDLDPEFWLDENEISNIAQKVPSLINDSVKILFHPSCAHPDKAYPTESFIELINTISQSIHFTAYFTGAKIDYELNQMIIAKTNTQCYNLAGLLDLRESIALINRMNLMISTDSGPAHIGYAAKIPTLAIFGPTDPIRWGPPVNSRNGEAIFRNDLQCRPCNYIKTCQNRECLTELSPILIANKVLKYLNC